MAFKKSYWSTLKIVLNNKKFLLFHPSLSHQNMYVADFKEKAEIFNSFFAAQCSLINNSCKLLPAFLKRLTRVMIIEVSTCSKFVVSLISKPLEILHRKSSVS